MAALQAPPPLGFSRQERWSGLPFLSPTHESENWKWSHSVVSDPQRPHGLQPSRLLRPWDFLGKSTGVGCHCLLLVRLKIPIIHWKQYMLGTVLSTFHPHPCKADILPPNLQCRRASLVAHLVKNLPASGPGFNPWVGKIPWRRKSYPLQYPGLENSMDCTVLQRQQGLASCFSQLAVDLSFLPGCVELQNFCLTTVGHKPLLKAFAKKIIACEVQQPEIVEFMASKLSSVQFNCSVVSDSLRPHGL